MKNRSGEKKQNTNSTPKIISTTINGEEKLKKKVDELEGKPINLFFTNEDEDNSGQIKQLSSKTHLMDLNGEFSIMLSSGKIGRSR